MLAAVKGQRWADVLILTAAVVTALGVLWRKVLQPMGRGAQTVERIYAEFRPNGGGSMRDSVDRTEVEVASLRAELETVRSKLAELHDYAHQWKHDQSGLIAGLTVRDEAITRRLDDLKANDTVKMDKLDEIASSLPPPT